MTHALLGDRTFVTNGGTETFLLFRQGFPLRDGCGFEVFDDDAAWAALGESYLDPILAAAQEHGHGLLLDALVWRAQAHYITSLGYPEDDLVRFNELAVRRTRAAVDAWRSRRTRAGAAADVPVLLAGDIGPRGDGYVVSDRDLTAEGAADHHRRQIEIVARAGVDLLSGLTMTSVAESIGLTRAAAETGLPIVLSPTVETDGRLPDGTPLGDLIARVDDATAAAPLFYMVNCAHPSHLRPSLDRAGDAGAAWLARFGGFRANASAQSHAELDESPELDRGDPVALAREVADMQRRYGLRVVGGCCGTDAEHIAAIAAATAG